MLARWKDAVTWARRGYELATQHGRRLRAGDFAGSVANGLVWGSEDATRSIAAIEELLQSETRRRSRASMTGAIAALLGIAGDRAAAEAKQAEADAMDRELGDRPRTFRKAFMEYGLDDLPGAISVASAESAELARHGENGPLSTMVAFHAWMLTLLGRHAEALPLIEESRRLGAPDDAVTQIVWRSAAALAQLGLGNLKDADTLSREAIEWAVQTDSMDAADAWEARAKVLVALGRQAEAIETARRARELHVAKGAVNLVRRMDRFLAEGVTATASQA
jgi:hypothetical protein